MMNPTGTNQSLVIFSADRSGNVHEVSGRGFEALAQRIEQRPSKSWVSGSNPEGLAKYLNDENAAYRYAEKILWANGIICPFCQRETRLYTIKSPLHFYKCAVCLDRFSVKKGTILEGSRIKLHLWLQALLLIVRTKREVRSAQLMRIFRSTHKAAWTTHNKIKEIYLEEKRIMSRITFEEKDIQERFDALLRKILHAPLTGKDKERLSELKKINETWWAGGNETL